MRTHALILAVLIIAGTALVSCGGDGAQNNGDETDATFENPFQYCKAVGTVDMPGERYTGDKVPDYIAEQLKEIFGAPESAPIEVFERGTYWRCMDHWLCAQDSS